jgi:hypothetical protein
MPGLLSSNWGVQNAQRSAMQKAKLFAKLSAQRLAPLSQIA